MILYFTGTGNSRYVAEKIGEALQEEPVSLNTYIKEKKQGEFHSDSPYIFVLPTYAWQMPHIIRDFIEDSHFAGSDKAYFVLTCGMSAGGAGEYAKDVCTKTGLTYMGVGVVVMPENYIAMFPVPDERKSAEIIKRAEEPIRRITETIAAGGKIGSEKAAFGKKLQSGIINRGFYRLIVSAKGFYAKENCIGCGRCEQVCPLNNIHLTDKRPVWGDHCTHCMACISQCPVEAIEYKKKSAGKRRYYLKGAGELER